MKIATYNVENLFRRAKVLNQDDNALTAKIQKQMAALTALFEKPMYSDMDKTKMIQLLKKLGLDKSDSGEFVTLKQIRENVLTRKRDKPIEIIANRRDDWVGWLELKIETVNEISIMNTGRVIRDVDADILAVVEAESRIGLEKFAEEVLNAVNIELPVPKSKYEQIMVIDGNDDRGIDVGIMAKRGCKIGSIQSHIYDMDASGNKIFSRDCPEYQLLTPSGHTFWVLPNHFKSKFGGNNAQSQNRRLAQAERTAAIYTQLLDAGYEFIIVLGDLNDTPDSNALKPLLATSLKDVSTHPRFDPGTFSQIGTFGSGTNANKIDYLLLSPALFSVVEKAGLFRMGAFPGVRPKWPVYETLTEKVHAASDHHVIWVDLNI